MISYGSQGSNAAMPMRDRSHQLGEGQKSVSEVPSCTHPPRSVYGSQSRYAAMPCNQLLPPVYERVTQNAQKCPHRATLSPVYGGQKSSTGSSHRHRLHQFTGAFVTTQQCPSMIAPTYSREVSFDSQKCHLSNASQGKGHHAPAEMPFMVRPSPPVYGRNTNRSQQCQMRLTLPPVLGRYKNAAMLGY